MDIKGIRWESVYWIDLVEDDMLWAVVNTAMNLVPKEEGGILD
jgi:hypothetical protein